MKYKSVVPCYELQGALAQANPGTNPFSFGHVGLCSLMFIKQDMGPTPYALRPIQRMQQ